MANKAISELPQAQNVNNQDLFVLEQSGIAKKLPAETFITEQGIINALAEALDGHGGIQSVTLSSVSGRIRTYRITFTDQSATTFQVYDGTSIDRISRTSSSGLDDVYTIFLSDGTTTFFTVHNGADGTVSEAMLNDALKNKAPAVTETTESSAIANFTDGADDMPIQSLVAEIEPIQDLTYGDPYPAGSKNQLIFKTISGNIESNGKIVSTTDFHLLVAKVTAAQTYISSADGVATSSGALVLAFFSSEPEIGSVSYDGQRITTGQNPFVAPIDGYVAIRVASNSDVRRQIEAGSTATAYFPYSNLCPITGHTEVNVTRAGKNELIYPFTQNSVSVNGVTATANSDGTVTVSGTCTASGSYMWLYGSSATSLMSTLKEGETYTYSLEGAVSGLNGQVIFYGSPSVVYTVYGVNTFPSVTFTAPDMSGYNGFAVVLAFVNGVTYSNVTVKPMIRLASDSDTTYEPYIAPTTVSLSWQTEAGTVYGGTIDVATGLLTVNMAYKAFSELVGWQYRVNQFDVSISDGMPQAEAGKPSAFITDTYATKASGTSGSYSNETCAWQGASTNQVLLLRVRDSSFTSVTDFLAARGNVNICYELATPQTYQLTPQEVKTLLGTNNVWADIGNVSVTYPADTKMFIEKLTMPTEDDLVANQAITSGKYFMIGNSLYLALANIASGAQITIGTNAQRVSLADALNTINS